MMTRQPRYGRWVLSVAAIAAVPSLAALLWFHKGPTPAAHAESAPEPKAESGLVTVKTVRPELGGVLRSTTQPCTVRAFDYEEMYAKVSGYLINQKVDIGSHVKKGEILAEIDAPEYVKDEQHAVAAVAQARSQVRQMEAHVVVAKADLDTATILIAQREAELKRTKSSLNYRQKQYNRYKELAEYKSVDQRLVDEQFEHYEAAEAAVDAASAGVKTAHADVEAKKAKVVQAEADLDAAKANVDVAEATREKAHVFVNFTKIRSHYDGVVTARNYHEGDYIRAAGQGDRPLLVVQRTDLMRVIIHVPDADVPYCRTGDPVDIAFSTLSLVKFPTYKVSRIAHSQDQKSRTMRVEADVPNDKDLLRDGMYGEATIRFKTFQQTVLEQDRAAVRIPSSALRRSGDKTYAYVVREGVVHPVSVHVGADNGSVAEVLAGLTVNDEIVNHPASNLQEGTKVRSYREAAAAH
jgi:HlyD family secretion protein